MRCALPLAFALAVLVFSAPFGQKHGEAAAQTFQYSEWKYLPPEEIVVNLYDLRDIVAVRTQTRSRDNAIIEQKAQFLLGSIHIQHTPANLFNQTSTDSIRDAAGVEAQLRTLLPSRDKGAKLSESRNLYAYGERGGWLHAFDLAEMGQTCYMSATGFLSDPGKNWDAGERYDTFVTFFDCSQRRSLYEIETWLKGMRLVSSEYNARRLKK